MMNIVTCYKTMLEKLLNLAGMEAIEVEIEPGTIIHFWVPSQENNKKPNVVLVHGFAGDGILTWQFLVLSLREKYNFYVPDLLFFGRSYSRRSERSPKFQADCLASGLKIVGLVKKCIVVGFSYGGMVSFQLAEHHPELVGSMVIIGSVLAETESISCKALARIGFASWVDYLIPSTFDGVKVLLDYCSYKNNFPKLPNFFYKHYLEVMFENRKERIELLEALVIKDEDVTNHQFKQPIHLIWGNQDKIFDMEVANNLKKRLGGKTKLLIVEEAGHLALLERPFVFNQRLREALDSFTMNTESSTN
ncbi:uncharacterized protein LOC141612739 [Silene latifolia]|uniref:uncharacterized protein LOC141612739 n=1 Tax=Silene latifolia TaxID=37657 RepID=UPI003D77D846